MRFYATTKAMEMIAGIADGIFGKLVEVPGEKQMFCQDLRH